MFGFFNYIKAKAKALLSPQELNIGPRSAVGRTFLCTLYSLHNVRSRSATNMRWIEEKMKLLGCDKNPNYKLAFYLDSR